MAERYMLDTNTASYLARAYPNVVHARMNQLPIASVCISAITEAELLFGLMRHRVSRDLEIAVREILNKLDILTWDSAAAASYATLRSALERAGTPLGNLDTLIAAHALAVDAVLVTNDRAFRHAAPDLVTEDWTRA